MTFTPGKVLTAAELNAALANYVPIASLASTASGQGGSRVGLSIGDTVEEFVAKLMSHNGSDIIGTPEGTVQKALEAQSAAIIKASTGRVALERFGIKPDGTEKSAQISDALVAAKSGGATTVEFAASPLGYGVDVGNSIWVPDGLTISGPDGGALIKGLGTAFRTDGAILYVADPATGTRYGAETGFRNTGTGATFNLTVSGGKVAAVAVASGGSGYKQGDRLIIANPNPSGQSATLYAMVTGGAVTSVVIASGGSGWSAPSNPYSHSNTTSTNRCDRIVNPSSFADLVVVRNLILDGGYGYGNPRLTGTQRYQGLTIYGVKDVRVSGLITRNFPNNGLMVFDCQNADIRDNLAENCGWTGVFGGPRNGFTSIGLFLLQNPELNTQYWNFIGNIARDIGDVGAHFGLVEGFDISHNQLLGCSTLGLEGESGGYAVWQTQAGNGIKPPGSGRISHNTIDGRMLNGRLGTDTASAQSINEVSIYGLLGYTWVQGNEGTIVTHDNTVKNTTGPAMKIAVNTGGEIIGGHGDVFENVNKGASTVSPVAPGTIAASAPTGASGNESYYAVQMWAGHIDYRGAKLLGGSPKAPLFWIKDNAQTNFIRCEVDVEGTTDATDTSSPAIRVTYNYSHANGTLDLGRTRLRNTQADGIIIEADGSGVVVALDAINAQDVRVTNANRANQASKAGLRTRVLNSANFGARQHNYDRFAYREDSLSSNTTTPIILQDNATITPTIVSLNDINAPQFATKYNVTGMTPQPSAFAARDATAAVPLLHPGYKSGSWYNVPGGSGTLTNAVIGGSAKFWPVYFQNSVSIAGAMLKVGTAGAAGSTAQIAVYANSGATNEPVGSALGTIIGIPTSSTGVQSATNTPFSVGPGWVWFGIMFSDAAVAIQASALTSFGGAAEILGSATGSDLFGGTNNRALVRTAGVSFGTWPFLSAGGTTPGLTGIPDIVFKAG